MKQHIITFALGCMLLGGVSSCSLDYKPESSLTYNGMWDTETGARAVHTGVVSRFRDYNHTMYVLGETRADIWGGTTIESPAYIDLMRNEFSATNAPFGDWAGFYGYLHQLNDLIVNLPQVHFTNDRVKHNFMAQAYGMRAYVYYTMLRTWGDVVITDKAINGNDLENAEALRRKRNSKEEVMAQILHDIKASLDEYENSADSWKGSTYWSKAATLTLKGDVLLWKGEVMNGGKADFAEAKKALEGVKGYELVKDWKKLWGQANEDNKEFIFAFDYAKDQKSNFYSSFTSRSIDVANSVDLEGEPLAQYGFSGGNRFGPSKYTLKTLFDTENDARQWTFLLAFDNHNKHAIEDAIEGDASYRGAILRKFYGILDSDGKRKHYANVPLYRYADVVLMLAEAKNNLGENPEEEINAIRQRAIGDDYPKFVAGTKLENKKAILNERFKEFIGEGKRWWDLVRAGDGLLYDYVSTMKASEPFRIYLPLPQGMIDDDPEFVTQTEGYE